MLLGGNTHYFVGHDAQGVEHAPAEKEDGRVIRSPMNQRASSWLTFGVVFAVSLALGAAYGLAQPAAASSAIAPAGQTMGYTGPALRPPRLRGAGGPQGNPVPLPGAPPPRRFTCPPISPHFC